MNERVLQALYDLGATDRAISRITGYSTPRIAAWRKRNGLPVQSDAGMWWAGAKRPGPRTFERWEDKHAWEVRDILEREGVKHGLH